MTNREYMALADALVRGYKRCPNAHPETALFIIEAVAEGMARETKNLDALRFVMYVDRKLK